MPPPVFCRKGPTAGHTGPAPTHPMRWTSVGRRALTPLQRTDSVVHPYELPFSFKSTERPIFGALGAFGF